MIRRQRGGAAVVMGALSPRTRNAQVELYQSGDVDFLVATDAVGMGLNMDVNHVAFAATRKFDGRQFRELNAGELGQIAGRAGRHMNDGTFGITADAKPFDPDMVERIEDHRFDALKVLQWRNRNLDFCVSGCPAQQSQSVTNGGQAWCAPVPPTMFWHSNAWRTMAIFVIWPAAKNRSPFFGKSARFPDYRNITGGDHAALVGTVYRHLMTGARVVPADWLESQLSYADRTDGDIDTLATRIAHIRTWSFIANRSDWLDNPAGWRERTREIEDRLSDALHERLTQRFIDRRTSILMKRLREKEDLMADVSGQGEILVEGEYIGRLTGFSFVADNHEDEVHGRALRAASLKVIADEIGARAKPAVAKLLTQPSTLIPRAGSHGMVRRCRARQGRRYAAQAWHLADRGRAVVRQAAPGGSGAAGKMVERPDRGSGWLLWFRLSNAEEITGLARGIAFRLVENLGVLVRDDVADDLRQLDQDARGTAAQARRKIWRIPCLRPDTA